MIPLSCDQVSIWMDAPAAVVYDLVADVTRTPEWSPEILSCEWVGGATGPVVGARFRARNRVKANRWSWSNQPVVEVADRGREFTFSRRERIAGELVWRYRFEPSGSGTTVTESYEVTRTIPRASYLLFRLSGSRERVLELRQGMQTTLARLKAAAEAAADTTGGR